jgi:hypothetical protein
MDKKAKANETIKVVSTGKTEVEVVKQKVERAVADVSTVVVKTDEDLDRAALVLTNVKKLEKFLIQEKEKVLKPLREATSAARAIFAPMEEQIANAQKTLSLAMITYHDKKEAETARKEASIAKRAEVGQLRPETAVRKMEELPETKTNVKTETGSVVFKKVKKVRVINEENVPNRFWEINLILVRSEALAMSNSLNKLGEVLPGIEVYEETSNATRA